MARGKKTGGRQKGTPNRGTRPLRDYAQQFTIEAVNGLLAVARNRKMPAAARVRAWQEILDRGHGRAPQALTGADGGPVPLAVTIAMSVDPEATNRT